MRKPWTRLLRKGHSCEKCKESLRSIEIAQNKFVADPKYVPANLCADPKNFGKRRVEWLEGQPTQARLDAARLQHVVAGRVRDMLRRERVTQEVFATSIGWQPARLSRILTGAAPAALEDILTLVAGSMTTLGAVAEAAGLAPDTSTGKLEYLAAYLADQQTKVAARIADTSRERPST